MVDVRGDILRPPHGTTPAAVKANKIIKLKKMSSFKSNENIYKKEDGPYYVVSANKASSVTLLSLGNESQRKHTAILRISNRQSIQRLILIKMVSKLLKTCLEYESKPIIYF